MATDLFQRRPVDKVKGIQVQSDFMLDTTSMELFEVFFSQITNNSQHWKLKHLLTNIFRLSLLVVRGNQKGLHNQLENELRYVIEVNFN